MAPSSSTAVLVAGSLLLAGLSYTYVTNGTKDTGKNTLALKEIDEEKEEDFITAEEVCKIFDELFLQMQEVLQNLMRQVQALQMQGKMIPEKQLQGMIRNELERALTAKQKILLEQADMDEDCLEEATWEFLEKEKEYPKVKIAVDRFQKMWENATGEQVSGWRPGMPAAGVNAEDLLNAERTIEIAEKYFSSLTELMRTIVNNYKKEGKSLNDPAVQQQLNMEFAQNATGTGEACLQQQGLTLAIFEASVKAHQDNPTVGRALGMLQMRQQQELMAIGGGKM